jgi:YD repeat-containing protein
VIETHNLAAYRSLGTARGLTLRYDSERADARPILHFGYNNVQSDPNLRLTAELTVKRGDFRLEVPGFAGGQYGLNGGENFWSIPGGRGKVDAALQADLCNVASGLYDYELTTGLVRLNNNQFSGSTSTSQGKFLHVNTNNSGFGSGWGLAGLQELVVNGNDSVIIIDGDGSELLFERNTEGGGYKSPLGDFSILERATDGTFRRTTTDQTVYTFDADNLLAGVRDRVGNETQYSYQNRLLSKIVDPVGLETVFAYSGNKIASITDPAGRSTRLTYGVNGNLTKITDPDGTSRTWSYDAGHHIVSEIDKRGDFEQTFYDFAGRASRSIRKDGSELSFDPIQVQGLYELNRTNDPLNAPVAFRLGAVSSTYVDANGQSIVNNLDQAGQTISSCDQVGFLPQVKRNNDNLVIEQTDARGNVTSLTYDNKGNNLTIQDSVSFVSPGGNTLIVNRGSDSRTTNFFTGILQAAGITTTVVADVPTSLSGFNQVVDIRFDALNTLTTGDRSPYLNFLQTGGKLFLTGENRNFAARNDSLLSLVTEAGGGSLTFVEPNFVQQVIAPFNGSNLISDGNVTYGGFATGGVTSAGTGQFVSVDTNGVGSAIRFAAGSLSNAAAGELTVIFDSNFFTDADDAADNQNLVRNLVGLERTARRFTYDPKFNQVTSYTDELGHQKLYQIDQSNGNLLSLTQVVGAVGGDDDLVSKFTYTAKGLVDLITDPLGRITDSDYDAQGRLIALTYAKGTVDEARQKFEYDAAGNQTAIIDENGNATRFEYDALSRLVKITEADPDGAGILLSPVTTYTYDADGNLISTTDAAGRVVQNSYDKLDRLTESIDALNQKTTYSYDALGNLLTAVDALGRKTENKYDARSRITETIAPDLGRTRFAYDLSDNLISRTNAINNRTTLAYDARNRLIGETDALGNSTRYLYDAANNLISQTDRNGHSTRYRYGDLDRCIQTQDALAWIIHEESRKSRKESLKRNRIKLSKI